MKKILFSIYTEGYPNKNMGGPNHIIYEIANHIRNRKYKIDYLSYETYIKNLVDNIDVNSKPIYFNKKITNLLYENISLYRKIVSSDLYLPYHFKKKEAKFNYYKKIVTNYDIIHSQDSLSFAYLADIHSKIKKILTIHSNGPLSNVVTQIINNVHLKNKIKKSFRVLEKSAVKMADVITFPSHAAKNIFFKDLDIESDSSKIKIIYNGIDIEKINAMTIEKNILLKYGIKKRYDLMMTNISAYREERQLNVLFTVLKTLIYKSHKKILLINIGSGSKCKPLVKLIKKMGLEENVKLLSNIPNEDVIKLLKATDIFIMTSKRVIFDLVVLEALACGACCVVSNDGGNKEIIKDGENGYLIETNDADDIVRKIMTIDINKTKSKAIETAKQFSVNKMVDEYFKLYEGSL